MRRFFLALLLVVTLRPCAAEIIQLEGQHGTYTVPVRINGAMTLPFVLDSGAAAVTIPEDVFLTLTRTGTLKTSDFTGTATVVLADGSQHASRRFVLHEVQVGSYVVRNVIANVVSVKGTHYSGRAFCRGYPLGRLIIRATLWCFTISLGL
jgi:predicted aspartyl protease